MSSLVAVLPILPGLVGLLSIVPALLAAGLAAWPGWFRSRALERRSAGRWWRFWLRQTPSLLVLLSLSLMARSFWGSRHLAPEQPATHPGIAHEASWPVPRGSLRRTGRSETGPPMPAGPVDVLWRFSPPGTSFYGDAVPHGDWIYVVGSRGNEGTIYALSQRDGRLLWSCRPEGYRATVSAPTVADNVLYVGEGLHFARNARLVAVSLAGPDTGQVLWTHRVPGHIECSPTLVHDRIYFAAGDDGVYCLQQNLGSIPPRLLWHVPGDRVPDADVSLTVWKGNVYVGMGTRGNGMAVLNADDGTERARWDMQLPVRSLPALQKGLMAISAGRGDLKRPGNDAGHLIIRRITHDVSADTSLDATPLASTPLPGVVLGAITVDQQGWLCGCADGAVRRFSLEGECLASWQSGAPITGSLVVQDDLVVGHNRDGWLFGVDPQSLQPLWRVRLGRAGNYVASAISSQGRIFVGTDEDGFVCVGTVAKPR